MVAEDMDFEARMVLVKDMVWLVATALRGATALVALVMVEWDMDSTVEGLEAAVAAEEEEEVVEEVAEKVKAEVVEVEAVEREDQILEATEEDTIGISVITMIEHSN